MDIEQMMCLWKSLGFSEFEFDGLLRQDVALVSSERNITDVAFKIVR